jgi:pimeloyl-ACP methyl ester carboxylesterase
LPKFCSKSATIASVQADYVEAAGTSVLVHQWPGRGGRNVLYWHGGGGRSDEWPRIAPALAGVGYSVYAPDAPGYGDSPRLEPEQYLASNIAELGVALIDELALSPVIWIGFSWGANVGIHAAVRHPDRLKALVLLDGGYLLPEDDPDYDPSTGLEARIAALEADLDPENPWDAPVDVVAAVMMGLNDDPGALLLPALEQTGIPMLLIASTEPPEYEALRARAHGRFRAALPSAELISVESDHGVLQGAGDEVRSTVLDWLARLG